MASRAPHPVDIATGLNIRRLRRQRRISQEWLAEMVGLTFQQIQKYERGANRMSCSRLMAIARALGVSPNHLLPPPDWLDSGGVPQWTGEMGQFYLRNEKLVEAMLDLSQRQLDSLCGVAEVFRDPDGTRAAG
jgi:transcriptional regulator with XRE-family HTH domain